MPRAAIRVVPLLAARIPNSFIRAITTASPDTQHRDPLRPSRFETLSLSRFETLLDPRWSTGGLSRLAPVDRSNSRSTNERTTETPDGNDPPEKMP